MKPSACQDSQPRSVHFYKPHSPEPSPTLRVGAASAARPLLEPEEVWRDLTGGRRRRPPATAAPPTGSATAQAPASLSSPPLVNHSTARTLWRFCMAVAQTLPQAAS